ncbi:MAG: ATP-binding protein [Oscillospiraceae bacterium]
MKELSLNILDIAMNSVKAGATLIELGIEEQDVRMTVTIKDNGCGMSEETVKRLEDPFFTTRTTRKVGLGVPFFVLAAQQTGGSVKITSVPEPDIDHGTTVKAVFYKDSIDFTPLGDIISTVVTFIQGYPQIDVSFKHILPGGAAELDTRDIKARLGDIPINSVEILNWIDGYLKEQYINP